MKVQVWVCVGKCRIIYPLMQVTHEQIFAFELLGISIYLATFVCLFNLWWPFLLHFLQSSLEGIKSLISSDYEGTIFYISHHPIPSTFWILWWFEKFIRVRIVDKIPFVQKWGKIGQRCVKLVRFNRNKPKPISFFLKIHITENHTCSKMHFSL